MEKKFDEQESMLVIRQMIEQAKGKLERGDGKYFLLWGYLVSITCIVHYLSYKLGGIDNLKFSFYIWNVPMAIGVAASFYFGWKDSKKETVSTYVGTMIGRIWIGFACTSLLVGLLLGGKYAVFIYPAISLVYAYATFLSASAYRMRWMYISAVVCLVCVILYKFVPFEEYPLLMAAMLICGNLIPGHIINYKAKRDV